VRVLSFAMHLIEVTPIRLGPAAANTRPVFSVLCLGTPLTVASPIFRVFTDWRRHLYKRRS
jgi:hypothetical protein